MVGVENCEPFVAPTWLLGRSTWGRSSGATSTQGSQLYSPARFVHSNMQT